MSEVCALVVGIDRYAQFDWTINGPCRNALAIVDQLRARGVPAGNIHLFLAVENDTAVTGAFNRLRADGVVLTTDAKHDTIDGFWRKKLPELKTGSKLFVFWSGHGMTSMNAGRVFAYENYTLAASGPVLDVEDFCRELRTTRYPRFHEQILIADVCGDYSRHTSSQHCSFPQDQAAGRLQIQLFATPEGEYAYVPEGFGEFTAALLAVLDRTRGWPVGTDGGQGFVNAVETAFEALDGRPHWCLFDSRGRRKEYLLGDHAGTLFRSCQEMLNRLAVPDAQLSILYHRTLIRLGGDRERWAANDLSAMLRFLCQLHIEEGLKAPKGLVDFLVRLEAMLGDRAGPLIDWLVVHCDEQPVATARDHVREEGKCRHLEVWVDHDRSGRLSSFRTFLRFANGTAATNAGSSITRVSTCAAMAEKLRSQIKGFHHDGVFGEGDRIHFIVNPPLFHLRFHDLLSAHDGSRLGEAYIVTIHYRERLNGSQETLRQLRHQNTEIRRTTLTPEPNWIDVGLGHSSWSTPGLHVTNFSLGRPNEGRAELGILMRLLRSGFPYLCLPYDSDLCHHDDKVEGAIPPHTLSTALRRVRADRLDDIPTGMWQARVNCMSIAQHSGLLWDNPDFLPFLSNGEFFPHE